MRLDSTITGAGSGTSGKVVRIIDHAFYQDVLSGLGRTAKSIPAKYLYDDFGVWLFAKVRKLDDYYLEKAELEILKNNSGQIAKLVGGGALVAEFGTGSLERTETLLAAFHNLIAYIAIDVSEEHLVDNTQQLAGLFPELNLIPLCADYDQPKLFTELGRYKPFTVFLPGSMIGQLEPAAAREFLIHLHQLTDMRGGIIAGVARTHDGAEKLLRAYNDREGMAAAFNKNILTRMNNELRANFDLRKFSHRAMMNGPGDCIEMHLVSIKDQNVRVMNRDFAFAQGETIHTSSMHLYSDESFRRLAAMAGYRVEQSWDDGKGHFSVYYLKSLL